MFRFRILNIFRQVKAHICSLWIFLGDCLNLKVCKKIYFWVIITCLTIKFCTWITGWSKFPQEQDDPVPWVDYKFLNTSVGTCIPMNCRITLNFHVGFCSLFKLKVPDFMWAILSDPMKGHIAFAPSKKRSKCRKYTGSLLKTFPDQFRV